MHPKAAFYWLYERAQHYNVFMQEEDHLEENQDRTAVLKHQKHSTRLYVLLLIVFFYVFFYIAMVKPQARTVLIFDVTPTVFEKLFREHEKSFSCPCSTVLVPYGRFIPTDIIMHSVCESIFVQEEWLEAVYLANASRYRQTDFRTIAYSQFELLRALCSLAHEMIADTQMEIGSTELATIDLLPADQLQVKVDAFVDSLRNSTSIRLMSFIDYIASNARLNAVVSSLNLNTRITVHRIGEQYVAKLYPAVYIDTPEPRQRYDCDGSKFSLQAGFYQTPHDPNYTMLINEIYHPTDFDSVAGFRASCTPVDAFFSSTLICLHKTDCLHLLRAYFPALQQILPNVTDAVLSSKQSNLSLYNQSKSLFVDLWLTPINYSEYFAQCAPSHCSHVTNDRKNISYAIALLISLYGGCIVILRLLTPPLTGLLFRYQPEARHPSRRTRLGRLRQTAMKLNLFPSTADRTVHGIRRQQLITRVYLLLLAISFVTLFLFHTLSTSTVTVVESNPSLHTYTELETSDRETLKCPCSTMIIPYGRFLSMRPTLHDICHSDFINERWRLLWSVAHRLHEKPDWRTTGASHFGLLASLCQLANETVEDVINRFLLQSFAVSHVLNPIDFHAQINASLARFFRSTTTSFRILIETTSLFMQVDQPSMGWTILNSDPPSAPLTVHVHENRTTKKRTAKFTFNLTGTHDIMSKAIDCICATNPDCQSSASFYDYSGEIALFEHPQYLYVIPEMTERCAPIDSLLFSTLECFYIGSKCFAFLSVSAQKTQGSRSEHIAFFARPLIYNASLTRFSRHTSVETLAKELFVEQWNPLFFYEQFYHWCAPKYCTYSRRMRSNSAFEVIIALVSMIGGLIASLRTITPHLIRLASYLWRRLTTQRQRRAQRENTTQPLSFDRLKQMIQDLLALLRTELIEMNLFSARDFNSRLDRATSKRFGQWATRLYLVLFAISLSVLGLYTLIEPRTTTKKFADPSEEVYQRLFDQYGDELRCLCALIAPTHDELITIEPRFHQICSSPFILDSWRENITSRLVKDLSPYERTDYRRFLSAHLQFLRGLCQLSMQVVGNTVAQFHTSLFISTELLSKRTLDQRLTSAINQSRAMAPTMLTHLLSAIRRTNHGNTLISTYGTNVKYIIPWDEIDRMYVPTEAIFYDGCSCGRYANCTSEAKFLGRNSSDDIPIQGFRIGCTPSESLLASTLECFYNRSCIQLIERYASIAYMPHSVDPLSNVNSRFAMNATVEQLVNQLFIEEWATTMSYANYFKRCKPSLCSYTYIARFGVLHAITFLLALQGGLSIVLQWLCPHVVQIIASVRQRRNRVRPASNQEARGGNVESRLRRCSLSLFVVLIILMCIITALILFSIYFARTRPAMMTAAVNLTTDDTPVPPTTTTPRRICQMQFKAVLTKTDDLLVTSPVLAHFNDDDALDLAFYSPQSHNMHVLLGISNGTFQEELIIEVDHGDVSTKIVVADFNNDHRMDIAFTNILNYPKYIGLVLSHVNGTFQPHKILVIPVEFSYELDIFAIDFDHDNSNDILLFSLLTANVYLFRGHGDGTFVGQVLKIFEGPMRCPRSIHAADMNHDGRMDILIPRNCARGVIIVPGRGNTTVGEHIFAMVGNIEFNDIVIGDFNGDARLDMVSSSRTTSDLHLTLAHDYDHWQPRGVFKIKKLANPYKLAAGDFNRDGRLDVVFSQSDPFRINILGGLENANCRMQTLLSMELNVNHVWIGVGDFNGDGFDDIVAIERFSSMIIVLLNAGESTPCENVWNATFIN